MNLICFLINHRWEEAMSWTYDEETEYYFYCTRCGTEDVYLWTIPAWIRFIWSGLAEFIRSDVLKMYD